MTTTTDDCLLRNEPTCYIFLRRICTPHWVRTVNKGNRLKCNLDNIRPEKEEKGRKRVMSGSGGLNGETRRGGRK